MNKDRSEYGGCLYFETPSLKLGGWFSDYKDHKIDVDCGRSAIQYILTKFNYERIFLPVYNCPLVAERIKEASNVEIHWYNINEDFMPDISINSFCEGDILLWVNYCGVMTDTTIDTVISFQDKSPVKVIIDNIPAYFNKPRMKAFNIYSCRKFIGVPDGGHIIGNDVEPVELPTYSDYENYLYLLKAIEKGSNSAYPDYQESEKRFRKPQVFGMPRLTKRILEGIDYDKNIKVRKENFMALHEALKESNRLLIDTSTIAPSVYPYLTTSINLRQNLLNNRIYVSRFWKHVLTNDLANQFEKDLAEYLIPLPIDQRYSIEDMNILADIVKDMEQI